MNNFLMNLVLCLAIFIFVSFLFFKLNPKIFDTELEKQITKARSSLQKNEDELLGKRIKISRDNNESIDINFYQNGFSKKQSAIFVCHGGTFYDGDADQLDSWCDRMANEWEKTIISINYTKLDKKKIPYQQDEIRDTVLYFAKNAEMFNLEPNKFVFLGFSSGAYLEVGASSLLKDRNFCMKGIILIQPFIDDSLINLADAHIHISPVSIIYAGTPKGDHIQVYQQHLEDAGVDVIVKNYKDAVPGFIEYNNPEFAQNKLYQKSGVFTDEQKDMARACEMWIGNQIDAYLIND